VLNISNPAFDRECIAEDIFFIGKILLLLKFADLRLE
jgi:hypothetical protein